MSGFTLVELVVVMAIVAVVLSIAIPSFTQTIQDNRRSANINEFVAAVNFARSEAMARRFRVSICRSAAATVAAPVCGGAGGWEQGWVVFLDADGLGTLQATDAGVDRDGDGDVDLADAILRQHGPLAGVTPGAASPNAQLRGNALITNDISFDRFGLAVGADGISNGSLSYCDLRGWSKGRQLILATGGQLRVVPTILNGAANPQANLGGCL